MPNIITIPWCNQSMCVEINKSRGFVVSPEDIDLLQNFVWCVKSNKHPYPRRLVTDSPGKYRQVMLHKEVAGRLFTNTDGYDIDHIDRNRRNNRRDNLRVVTRSVNRHNTLVPENVGTYQIPSGRYMVCLACEGKQIYGGVHESLDLAVLKRKELEITHLGYIKERI